VTDWAVLLLILEGIPFLAFIYYLEYQKKMHLLKNDIVKDEPLDVRLERRLISGIFLSLAGVSLIISPSIARFAGLEASLTFEMLVMGVVVLSSGLAMLLGYSFQRGNASDSDSMFEFK